MRTIAAARGLDLELCKKNVAYSTIVREAAPVVGGDPDQAEAIWRTLSGLTHGDLWASIAVPDQDEVAVSADGEVITFRTTSSLTNIANLTSMAVSMTGVALTLFDQRRTNHI